MYALFSRSFRLLLFVVLSQFSSMVFAAGPDPGINVTVTNPPSQPIPVVTSGTTTVSGSVSITGQPVSVTGSMNSQQQGAWTVGLDAANNQVKVVNSLANPLFVQSVDSNGFKPFSRSFGVVGGQTFFIDVPVGMMLIIEHIDFFATVPPGDTGYAFFREFAPAAQGPRTFHYVVASKQFQGFNVSVQRSFANEAVRYLLEPGSRLSVEFGTSSNGDAAATVNVTGQFVEL
jgi:hypothetical protein